MKTNQVRTILSLIWLIFTLSLVTWWFIFALRNLNVQDVSESAKHYKMLFYEGSTLLLLILLGGIVLIVLSYRDDRRHKKIKIFFANFTHEIKTSITRIRLQADILLEEKNLQNNKILQRLLSDVAKLDLQLENSLLLSHVSEPIFLTEKIDLKKMINSIQLEFEDLKIELQNTALVNADVRALKSIFRNLFENSRRHGKASVIQITAEKVEDDLIRVLVQDNGLGNQRRDVVLGKEILSTSQNQGSGIGLYLSKQLITKMNGDIFFENSNEKGFRSILKLKGQIV